MNKLIAGPGIYICDPCVQRCVGILRTETLEQPPSTPYDHSAPIPSWRTMTDEELLTGLPRIASVAAQVEGFLKRWVGEARRRRSSWADIGESLGMSRQAAWERFALRENEAL